MLNKSRTVLQQLELECFSSFLKDERSYVYHGNRFDLDPKRGEKPLKNFKS